MRSPSADDLRCWEACKQLPPVAAARLLGLTLGSYRRAVMRCALHYTHETRTASHRELALMHIDIYAREVRKRLARKRRQLAIAPSSEVQ